MVDFVLLLAGRVSRRVVLIFVDVLEAAGALKGGDAGRFDGNLWWFEDFVCVQGKNDVFVLFCDVGDKQCEVCDELSAWAWIQDVGV